MSKVCKKHECFKKEFCRQKIFLGRLALCLTGRKKCPYCAPNKFGRYEAEDVLLP